MFAALQPFVHDGDHVHITFGVRELRLGSKLDVLPCTGGIASLPTDVEMRGETSLRAVPAAFRPRPQWSPLAHLADLAHHARSGPTGSACACLSAARATQKCHAAFSTPSN